MAKKEKQPPILEPLSDVELLAKIDKAAKLKAVEEVIKEELDTLKIEILLKMTKPRETCPRGYVQKSNGKSSKVFSALGKAKIQMLEEELKLSGDLTIEVGQPFLTVSATTKADREEVLKRLFGQ